MNFKTFMQKLDGKQDETIDSATETSGTLDVQSIMRIARGLGYSLESVEGRSDFPDGILSAFNGGRQGVSCDTMGLHRQYPSYSHTELNIIQRAGERYSQRSNGDTPSSVQEGVPAAPESMYAESERNATDGYIPEHDLVERENRDIEWTTVGGATSNTLSGPEPTYDEYRIADERHRANQRWLREALSGQESGVQGVRDEWSHIERSTEDTW